MSSAGAKRYIWTDLVVPLLILLAATAIFRFTSADLAISRSVFAGHDNWPYGENGFVKSMYRFGAWPMVLLLAGSTVALALSLWRAAWRPARRSALFIFLFLLIGPALLGNIVVKAIVARPRPAQIDTFGGTYPFVHVFEFRSDVRHGSSFPSGHACAAFGLLAPCFLFRRQLRKLWWSFLGCGLAYGLIMGICRIVQGKHYASDVLWSAGLVYLTGLALSEIIKPDGRELLSVLRRSSAAAKTQAAPESPAPVAPHTLQN